MNRFLNEGDYIRHGGKDMLDVIAKKRNAIAEYYNERSNDDTDESNYDEDAIVASAVEEGSIDNNLKPTGRKQGDQESTPVIETSDNSNTNSSAPLNELNKSIKSKPIKRILSAINSLKNAYGTNSMESSSKLLKDTINGLVAASDDRYKKYGIDAGKMLGEDNLLSQDDIDALGVILDDKIEKASNAIKEKGGISKLLQDAMYHRSSADELVEDVKNISALKEARKNLKLAKNKIDSSAMQDFSSVDDMKEFASNLGISARQTAEEKNSIADKYNIERSAFDEVGKGNVLSITSLDKMGKFVDAGRAALEDPKLTPEQRADIEKRIADVENKIAEDTERLGKNFGSIDNAVNFYNDYIKIKGKEDEENRIAEDFNNKYGNAMRNISGVDMGYERENDKGALNVAKNMFLSGSINSALYTTTGLINAIRGKGFDGFSLVDNIYSAVVDAGKTGDITDEYAMVNSGRKSGNASRNYLETIRMKSMLDHQLQAAYKRKAEIEAKEDEIDALSESMPEPTEDLERDKEAIYTAKRRNEEAIKTLEAQDIMMSDNHTITKIGMSLKNNLYDNGARYWSDLITFGVRDFIDHGTGDLMDKAEKGEQLRDSEKLALESEYYNQKAQQLSDGLKESGYSSNLYDYANGAFDMLQFAIPISGEVKAVSWIGKGAGYLSKIGKTGSFVNKAAKFVGKPIEFIASNPEERWAKTVGYVTGKLTKEGQQASRLANVIAKTAATGDEAAMIGLWGYIDANTIGLGMRQRTYDSYKTGDLYRLPSDDTYHRQFRKYNNGEVIDTEEEFEDVAMKATSGEYGSERSGFLIGKALNNIPGISRLSRTFFGRANKLLTKYTMGVTSGLLEETGEEIANNIWGGAMHINNWDDVVDPQKNLDIVLHLATSMGGQCVMASAVNKAANFVMSKRFSSKLMSESRSFLFDSYVESYRKNNNLESVSDDERKRLFIEFNEKMKGADAVITSEIQNALDRIKRGDFSAFDETSTVGQELLEKFGLNKPTSEYTEQDKLLASTLSQYVASKAFTKASNRTLAEAIVHNAKNIHGKSYNQLIASSGGTLKQNDADPYTLVIQDEDGNDVDTGIAFNVDEKGNATPISNDDARVNMVSAFGRDDSKLSESTKAKISGIQNAFTSQQKALVRNAYIYNLLARSGRTDQVVEKLDDKLDTFTSSGISKFLSGRSKDDYTKIGDDRYVIKGSDTETGVKNLMSEMQYMRTLGKIRSISDITFGDVFKSLGIENNDMLKDMWLANHAALSRMKSINEASMGEAFDGIIENISKSNNGSDIVTIASESIKSIIESNGKSRAERDVAIGKLGAQSDLIKRIIAQSIINIAHENSGSAFEKKLAKYSSDKLLDELKSKLGIDDAEKIKQIIDVFAKKLYAENRDHAIAYADSQLNNIALSGTAALTDKGGNAIEEYKTFLAKMHNSGITTEAELFPEGDYDTFSNRYNDVLRKEFDKLVGYLEKTNKTKYDKNDTDSLFDYLKRAIFSEKAILDSINELTSNSDNSDLIKALLSGISNSDKEISEFTKLIANNIQESVSGGVKSVISENKAKKKELLKNLRKTAGRLSSLNLNENDNAIDNSAVVLIPTEDKELEPSGEQNKKPERKDSDTGVGTTDTENHLDDDGGDENPGDRADNEIPGSADDDVSKELAEKLKAVATSIVGEIESSTPGNSNEWAKSFYEKLKKFLEDNSIPEDQTGLYSNNLYNNIIAILDKNGVSKGVKEAFTSCLIIFGKDLAPQQALDEYENATRSSAQGVKESAENFLADFVYYIETGKGEKDTFLSAFEGKNQAATKAKLVYKIFDEIGEQLNENNAVEILSSYAEKLKKLSEDLINNSVAGGVDANTLQQMMDIINTIEFQIAIRDAGSGTDTTIGYLYGRSVSKNAGAFLKTKEKNINEIRNLLDARLSLVNGILAKIDGNIDNLNNIRPGLVVVSHPIKNADKKLASNVKNSAIHKDHCKMGSDNVYYVSSYRDGSGSSILTPCNGTANIAIQSNKISQAEFIVRVNDGYGNERNIAFRGVNIVSSVGKSNINARRFADFVLSNLYTESGDVNARFIEYLKRFLLIDVEDGTYNASISFRKNGDRPSVYISYINDKTKEREDIGFDLELLKNDDEATVNSFTEYLGMLSFNLRTTNFANRISDGELEFTKDFVNAMLPGIIEDEVTSGMNIAEFMQDKGMFECGASFTNGKLDTEGTYIYVRGVAITEGSMFRRLGNEVSFVPLDEEVPANEELPSDQSKSNRSLSEMNAANAGIGKNRKNVYGITSVIAGEAVSTFKGVSTKDERAVGTIFDAILRAFFDNIRDEKTTLFGIEVDINNYNKDDIKELLKSDAFKSKIIESIKEDSLVGVPESDRELMMEVMDIASSNVTKKTLSEIADSNRQEIVNEFIKYIVIQRKNNWDDIADDIEAIISQSIEVYKNLNIKSGDKIITKGDANTNSVFDGQCVAFKADQGSITINSGEMNGTDDVIFRGETDMVVLRSNGSVDIYDFKLCDAGGNIKNLENACLVGEDGKPNGKYCNQMNMYRIGCKQAGINVNVMHVLGIKVTLGDNGYVVPNNSIASFDVNETNEIGLDYSKKDVFGNTIESFKGTFNPTKSAANTVAHEAVAQSEAKPDVNSVVLGDEQKNIAKVLDAEKLDDNNLNLFERQSYIKVSNRPVQASIIKMDKDGIYVDIADAIQMVSDPIIASVMRKVVARAIENGVTKIRFSSNLGSAGRTIIRTENNKRVVSIYVNTNTIDDRGAFSETVMHEMIHAALAGLVTGNYSRRSKKLYERYQQYLSAGATDRSIVMKAIVTDFEEFIAEMGNSGSLKDFVRWSRVEKLKEKGFPKPIAKLLDLALSLIGDLLEFIGLSDISTKRVKRIVFGDISDMISKSSNNIGAADGIVIKNRANMLDIDGNKLNMSNPVKAIYGSLSSAYKGEFKSVKSTANSAILVASIVSTGKCINRDKDIYSVSSDIANVARSAIGAIERFRKLGSGALFYNEDLNDFRVLLSLIDANISNRLRSTSGNGYNDDEYAKQLLDISNALSGILTGEEISSIYSNNVVREAFNLIKGAISKSESFKNEFNDILTEIDKACSFLINKDGFSGYNDALRELNDSFENKTLLGIVGFRNKSIVGGIGVGKNNDRADSKYVMDTTYFIRNAISSARDNTINNDIASLFRHVKTKGELSKVISSVYYNMASLILEKTGVDNIVINTVFFKTQVGNAIRSLHLKISEDPKNADPMLIKQYETLRDIYDNLNADDTRDSGVISNVVIDTIRNLNSLVKFDQSSDGEYADGLQDVIQYKETAFGPLETMSKRVGLLTSIVPKSMMIGNSIVNIKDSDTGFNAYYDMKDVYQKLQEAAAGASTLREFVSNIHNAAYYSKSGVLLSFDAMLAQSELVRSDTTLSTIYDEYIEKNGTYYEFSAGYRFTSKDIASLFSYLNRDILDTVKIVMRDGESGYGIIKGRSDNTAATSEFFGVSRVIGNNIIGALNLGMYNPSDDDIVKRVEDGLDGLFKSDRSMKEILNKLGFTITLDEADRIEASGIRIPIDEIKRYVVFSIKRDKIESENNPDYEYTFTSNAFAYDREVVKEYKAIHDFIRAYTSERRVIEDSTATNSKGEIISLNKQSNYIESWLRKIRLARGGSGVYSIDKNNTVKRCSVDDSIYNDIYKYIDDSKIVQINTLSDVRRNTAGKPTDYKNRNFADYMFERAALLLNGFIVLPTMANNGFGEAIYSESRMASLFDKNGYITKTGGIRPTKLAYSELDRRARIEVRKALDTIADLRLIAGSSTEETISKYNSYGDKSIFVKNKHFKKISDKSFEVGKGVTLPRFGSIVFDLNVNGKNVTYSLNTNSIIEKILSDSKGNLNSALTKIEDVLSFVDLLYYADSLDKESSEFDRVASLLNVACNKINDVIEGHDGVDIAQSIVNYVCDKKNYIPLVCGMVKAMAKNTIDTMRDNMMFDADGNSMFTLPALDGDLFYPNIAGSDYNNTLGYMMALETLSMISLTDFENFYGFEPTIFKDDVDQTKRYQSAMSTGSEPLVAENDKPINTSSNTDEDILGETYFNYVSMKDVGVAEDMEGNVIYNGNSKEPTSMRDAFRDLAMQVLDRGMYDSDEDYEAAIDLFVEIRINKLGGEAGDKNEIASSDGACFITLEAYKKYLIKEGRYRLSDIEEYFEKLSKGEELSRPELVAIHQRCILSPMKLVYVSSTVNGDKTKSDDGVVTNKGSEQTNARVLKMAVFPLLPGMCGEGSIGRKMLKIAEKTGADLIGDAEIEKVGSSHVDEMFRYSNGKIGAVSGLDTKVIKPVKMHFQMLRRQLDTNPHEDDERKLGTQLMAILQGNLTGQEVTLSDGSVVMGDDICASIRDKMNNLQLIEKIRLYTDMIITDGVNEYIAVDKLKDIIGSAAELNKLGTDVFSAARKIGDRDAVPMSLIMSSSLIQSKIMAIVRDRVQSIQSRGGAFIQVPQTIFRGLNGTGGRQRLKLNNNKNSMDCIISVNAFSSILSGVDWSKFRKDHGIPDTGNKNEYSINEARIFLTENNIIGENANPFGVGYRVPTQSKASTLALRVVDIVGAECGDVVVLPDGYVNITGSDFDIDKLYVAAKAYVTYNNKVLGIDEYELEYKMANRNTGATGDSARKIGDKMMELRSMALASGLIDDYLKILTSPSQFAETHTTIDSGSNMFKDEDTGLIKRLNTTNSGKVTKTENGDISLYSNSLIYQINKKMENAGATDGIAPFALASVNHVYAQQANLRLSQLGSDILGGATSLSGIKSRDGIFITDWLSYFINAHVDAVKDPYILDFNVNRTTWSMATLLLRAGFGQQTLFLLSQESVRVLSAAESMSESCSYENYKARASSRKNEIIREYVGRKVREFGIDAINGSYKVVSPGENFDFSQDYMFNSDFSINPNYSFSTDEGKRVANILLGNDNPRYKTVIIGEGENEKKKFEFHNDQIDRLKAMSDMSKFGEGEKSAKETAAVYQLILLAQMNAVNKVGKQLDTIVATCQVEQGKTGINIYGFDKYLNSISGVVNTAADKKYIDNATDMYSKTHFLNKIVSIDGLLRSMFGNLSASTASNSISLYSSIIEDTGNKFNTNKRVSSALISAIETQSLIDALEIDRTTINNALFGDGGDISKSAGVMWNSFKNAISSKSIPIYNDVFDESTIDAMNILVGSVVNTSKGPISHVTKNAVFGSDNDDYIDRVKMVLSRLYYDNATVNVDGNSINTKELVEKLVVSSLFTGGLIKGRGNVFQMLMPYCCEMLDGIRGDKSVSLSDKQTSVVNSNSFATYSNEYEIALSYGHVNGIIQDYSFDTKGRFDEFEIPDIYTMKVKDSSGSGNKKRVAALSNNLPVAFVSSNSDLGNKAFVRIKVGRRSKIYIRVADSGVIKDKMHPITVSIPKVSSGSDGKSSMVGGKITNNMHIFVEAPMFSEMVGNTNVTGIYDIPSEYEDLIQNGGNADDDKSTPRALAYIDSVIKTLVAKRDSMKKDGVDTSNIDAIIGKIADKDGGRFMTSTSMASGYLEDESLFDMSVMFDTSKMEVSYVQGENDIIQSNSAIQDLTSIFTNVIVRDYCDSMEYLYEECKLNDSAAVMFKKYVDINTNIIDKNIKSSYDTIDSKMASLTIQILNDRKGSIAKNKDIPDDIKKIMYAGMDKIKDTLNGKLKTAGSNNSTYVDIDTSKDTQGGINGSVDPVNEVKEAINRCLK